MEKSYREKMLEAMRWEDSSLRQHIETRRLDNWTTETQRLAEQAVEDEYGINAGNLSTGNLLRMVSFKRSGMKLLGATKGRNGRHLGLL